jgi:hypothetical protein
MKLVTMRKEMNNLGKEPEILKAPTLSSQTPRAQPGTNDHFHQAINVREAGNAGSPSAAKKSVFKRASSTKTAAALDPAFDKFSTPQFHDKIAPESIPCTLLATFHRTAILALAPSPFGNRLVCNISHHLLHLDIDCPLDTATRHLCCPRDSSYLTSLLILLAEPSHFFFS